MLTRNTEFMTGTRFSHSKIAVPGQRITYELTPPRALSSYYTKVVISDVEVHDLQWRSGPTVIRSNPNDPQKLEFPDDLEVRDGEISFTVTKVSVFGKAVINVHKFSTSFYNHYL